MKYTLISTSVLSALLFSTSHAYSQPKSDRKYLFTDPENPGFRPSLEKVPEVILTALEPVDLPENFAWGNVNGVNYLTNIKNQHIPQYCGSCWAQAASSSMSDRIKIMRKAAWPDINIAPQVLISCE